MKPKSSKPSVQRTTDGDSIDESTCAAFDAAHSLLELNYRLLTEPVSKWKKDDWKSAAKALAKPKPQRGSTGLIGRVRQEGYVKQVRDRINRPATTEPVSRKRGRPRKWHNPQKLLANVDGHKAEVAEARGIPIEQVTDKMSAEIVGTFVWENGSGTERTKAQQIAFFEKSIKSLRKIVKVRE